MYVVLSEHQVRDRIELRKACTKIRRSSKILTWSMTEPCFIVALNLIVLKYYCHYEYHHHYIYIYVYVCVYIYYHIYIYIERERERDSKTRNVDRAIGPHPDPDSKWQPNAPHAGCAPHTEAGSI